MSWVAAKVAVPVARLPAAPVLFVSAGSHSAVPDLELVEELEAVAQAWTLHRERHPVVPVCPVGWEFDRDLWADVADVRDWERWD